MKASAVLPTPSAALPTAAPRPSRLDSVDLLRGLVMVLMALDHTRDFIHAGTQQGLDPLDLKTTSVALFLTRWITHFCAPTFIFLAGTSAFLSSQRGKSKGELSWFLLTRGAWLILLELTFIHWAGWSFTFNVHTNPAIVIWAIGWSMIALAALVHLPLWTVTAVGVVMIVGHNALDGLKPESWGPFAWLWRILHAGGPIEFAPGYVLRVGYPLVPWIGVMAAGYGFGSVLLRERAERRRTVFRLGAALTAGFVLVRSANVYGDGHPWTSQANAGLTLLSAFDCVKYPPSLCYLLMTLGPALMLLAMLDRDATPSPLQPLLAFGRVPFFYYLIHLPLIHGLAVLIETIRLGSAPWLFGEPFGVKRVVPTEAGLSLGGTYLVWLTALVILYPACRWFAELKRRRRDTWLSYF